MQVSRPADVKQLKQQYLMLKVFALMVLLLVVARPLYAADWEEFRGRAVEGATAFVDKNSVEIDRDTIVKGWVKFEYTKPKSNDGWEVTSRVTYRMVNCETNRYWTVEDMLNVKNRIDPISLERMGFAQQWQTPVPGTESAMVVEALCYETRSIFGVMWDTVEDTYQTPKAVEVEKISTDELAGLGIMSSPEDTQFKAWVGVTSVDSKVADLRSNHIVLTKDSISFVGWDKNLQKFKKDTTLPLNRISSVIWVHGGTFEHLRQIHLITETGKTVISFSIGENDVAESVFAKLVKAGLNNSTSSRYVHGYREDTVIVPVVTKKK